MKRISVLAVAVMLSATSFAQKYDDVKNPLMLGQTAKAKEALDKNNNEKFYSKPEGYMAQSAVLASLSLDSAKAAEADKNRDDAYAAFEKYKAMDASMKLLEDPVYKNTPFNLYASYFNAGVKDINEKQYEASYKKFVKVVDLADILIAKKLGLTGPVDTNALYYAGILAEQTKHTEESVKYNTRLADLRVVKGPNDVNFETVYQGLVRYYAGKNDNVNFEKYRALGKELFPKSEFFTYNMLDFAVGSSENFDQKIKNLETIIAANPNDYKANLVLGEAIFDTLNSRREGAVLPANFEALEAKMLAALNKAASINASEIQPILLMGDHYTTKSEKLGDEMKKIEAEVIDKKAKATAADKQKLADAKKKYDVVYDLAKDNFEKAADMFSKKTNLDAAQKRQYRIIAGNLAQYYSYKREGAKGAEMNKYVSLETKYNNLYDQLKK